MRWHVRVGSTTDPMVPEIRLPFYPKTGYRRVTGYGWIGTAELAVITASIFRSHVSLLLPRHLKLPFTANGNRFASPKLVIWDQFSQVFRGRWRRLIAQMSGVVHGARRTEPI
jgi:hypothetical protein